MSRYQDEVWKEVITTSNERRAVRPPVRQKSLMAVLTAMVLSELMVYLHKTDIGEKRAYLILESIDHLRALKMNRMDQSASAQLARRLQNHRSPDRLLSAA